MAKKSVGQNCRKFCKVNLENKFEEIVIVLYGSTLMRLLAFS